MKTCTRCKEPKELADFNKERGRADGRASHCSECDKKRDRNINKEAKQEYERKRYLEKCGRGLIQPHRKLNIKADTSYEYHKIWRSLNGEKRKLAKHKRRALEVSALGEVSFNIEEKLLLGQSGLCMYCDKPLIEQQLEHMIPLARGGMHDDSNLCLSCPDCNRRKHTKTAEEFMKQ